jgi:hypothetical protein
MLPRPTLDKAHLRIETPESKKPQQSLRLFVTTIWLLELDSNQ